MTEIYNNRLLALAKDNKFHIALDSVDAQISKKNPLCGDNIDILLALDKDKISAVQLLVSGCALLKASSNALAEKILHMHVAEVRSLAENFIDAFKGDRELPSGSENLKELLVLKDFPARSRCVLLPFEAMLEISSNYSFSNWGQ